MVREGYVSRPRDGNSDSRILISRFGLFDDSSTTGAGTLHCARQALTLHLLRKLVVMAKGGFQVAREVSRWRRIAQSTGEKYCSVLWQRVWPQVSSQPKLKAYRRSRRFSS